MSLINNMLQGLEKESVRHVAFEDEESHFSFSKLKAHLFNQSGLLPLMVVALLVLIISFARYGFVENNDNHFVIGFKKQAVSTQMAPVTSASLSTHVAGPAAPVIPGAVVQQAPIAPSQVQGQMQGELQAQPMPTVQETNQSSETIGMPVSLNKNETTDSTLVVDNSPLGLSLKALDVSNHAESQTDMSRLLAISYVHMNRIDDAINILANTVPDIKTDPEHYALLAALYQRTAQHNKAIDIYWKLVEHYPQGGKWWAGLAISLEAVGEKRDALEGFKHARLYKDLSSPLAQYVAQRIKVLKQYS